VATNLFTVDTVSLRRYTESLSRAARLRPPEIDRIAATPGSRSAPRCSSPKLQRAAGC
jgi:hypothetical protein